MQARLPALLDRANATLQTLEEIVGKIPDSLDRTDRFLTNMDRTVRDSQLPELSAETRNFYATTNAQIGQIKSELDGVIGTEGTLVKFSEEARSAIKDADIPGTTQAAREAADNSKLASDDLRRSLPAIRESMEQMSELARQLQEQPESMVWGPRQEQVKHK
jgi:ABC-type transporter Mla subunit MlaD